MFPGFRWKSVSRLQIVSRSLSSIIWPSWLNIYEMTDEESWKSESSRMNELESRSRLEFEFEFKFKFENSFILMRGYCLLDLNGLFLCKSSR